MKKATGKKTAGKVAASKATNTKVAAGKADNTKGTLDVDAYLATGPADMRAALEGIRKQIKATVPGVEELISYGIPIFKYNGSLLGIGYAKTHCGLYVMSKAVMEQFADELKSYNNAPTTIRFTPDKPLPAALVKKIIKARVDENDKARVAKKK